MASVKERAPGGRIVALVGAVGLGFVAIMAAIALFALVLVGLIAIAVAGIGRDLGRAPFGSRAHLADPNGVVELEGNRIAVSSTLEELPDGEVCADLAITTMPSVEPPRVDEFAFGVSSDVGTPHVEDNASLSSVIDPGSEGTYERAGRICAIPRSAERGLVLRWHPHLPGDPVGIWLLERRQ